jgi:hypothetical protein
MGMKGLKTGGRKKGSKNILFKAELIAQKYNMDPFEVLMQIACGDWKALGFDAKTKTAWLASGIEFEEDAVKLGDRLQAAKEACKYLHSTKQAVEMSTGEEGFIVTIRDYTKKE